MSRVSGEADVEMPAYSPPGALTKGSQGLLSKSLLANIDSYLNCRPSVNMNLKTKSGKSI